MIKYFDQAKLMLTVLPIVGQEEAFALKGGTALNFFYFDMPRLSVDLDLTLTERILIRSLLWLVVLLWPGTSDMNL